MSFADGSSGLRSLDLAGGSSDARWTLRLLEAAGELQHADPVRGRQIQARVPGCVHTDLMAAGLLEDPYIGTNELAARWVGECSWRYTAHFQFEQAPALRGNAATSVAPEHPVAASLHDAGTTRLDLVFEGIDTLATVRLNGAELGVVDNMHATWRFEVGGIVRLGANELEIDFPAPLPFCRAEIERYRREIGDFPAGGAGSNPQLPQHMLRKMHCNFGWDWGPQLVTCGIWRAVRLEAWNIARIAAVRPQVSEADERHSVVQVHVDVEGASDGQIELRWELVDPEGNGVANARQDLPRVSPPVAATMPGRGPAASASRTGPRPGMVAATGDHSRHLAQLTFDIQVDHPRLWWPAGHGEQPLYTLNVSLHAKDGGALLHRVSRKIGLRRFEWVTAPDEAPAVVAGATQPLGATFHLRVNGRRIFCKGANWIPDDCFPHRVTPERYRRRIGQARDAKMNMLRVWGGGIYEDDAFYDACDELGVMVWQDFATACSCYPEDDAFRRRFEHEARDNVARLAGRASLALWCGGNESIQAVHDWGPEYRRMRQVDYGWGRHYWYELFPRIVSELDPGTFYWPNSPWSASDEATDKGVHRTSNIELRTSNIEVPEQHSAPVSDPSSLRRFVASSLSQALPANLEHVGDQHLWDVWNGQGDWRNYWSHVPRFASEFGFHGPPTWPTLVAAIAPDERHWFSETCVLHNKQEGGQERAIARAADHFTLPPRPESRESFEAMWFIAALNQARAIQAGCEWFRALSPWCGGALYWQLNDCWPVASWSAIDNDSAGVGRPKLLWYATRRFFAPRMCALLPETVRPIGAEAGRPRVYMHNDHPQRWSSVLRLRLMQFDGRALEEVEAPFEIEPGGSLRFIVPGDWEAAPNRLIVAEADGASRATWFFGRDKDLPYPQPAFELQATSDGTETTVTITAQTLLRDLCIFADQLDPAARVSDQLLTLLSGEPATLRIEGSRRLGAEELLAPGIIRCANGFGLPHRELSERI